MKDVSGFTELAAVLVLLAVGVSVVRAAADVLPEDTNTIESLTPEQARKLAQEFPGVPVDVEFKGFGRTPLQKCLPLNGLKSLDAETAKALAEYKSHLLLNGLTTLSVDAAKPLEEHKIGWLSLDGLTTLSDEVAKALVKHKGVFLLNGLTTLSGETALTLTQLRSLEVVGDCMRESTNPLGSLLRAKRRSVSIRPFPARAFQDPPAF